VELFKLYGTDPDKMVSALQREAMIAMKVAENFQAMKKMQEEMSGNQEDPLVALKKQELEQSAKRDQQRGAVDQARLALDGQKAAADIADDQANLRLKEAALEAKTGVDYANIDIQGAQHAAQVSQQQFQNYQALNAPQKGQGPSEGA
jgi:hypothetical protein